MPGEEKIENLSVETWQSGEGAETQAFAMGVRERLGRESCAEDGGA